MKLQHHVRLATGLTAAVWCVAAATAEGRAAPTPAAPTCAGKAATIVARGPTAKGTSKADVIVVVRQEGSRVDGRGGKDLICGGPGADRLQGGPGADRISGGNGDDRLEGDADRDVLLGEEGDDRLDGRGQGGDRLAGGPGVDRLTFTTRQDEPVREAGDFYNGRRQKDLAVLRPGVVKVPASRAIVGVNGSSQQTLNLKRNAPRVRAGQVVVVPATSASPGALGRVIRLKKTKRSTVATLAPADLDDAYREISFSFGAPQASSSRFNFGSLFTYTVGPNCGVLSNKSSLESLNAIGAEIDLGFKDISGQGKISFGANAGWVAVDMMVEPDFKLTAALNECEIFVSTRRGFQVGGTPLVIRPYGQAKATIKGGVNVSSSGGTYLGIVAGRNSNGWFSDKDDFTNLYASSSRIFDTLEAEGGDEISLTAGLQVSADTPAGTPIGGLRIGASGEVTATATRGEEDCVEFKAAVVARGNVFLDKIVKGWTSPEVTQSLFSRESKQCRPGRADPPPTAPVTPTQTPGPEVEPEPTPGPPFDPGPYARRSRDRHSCVIVAAVLRCWGNNDGGQLGLGDDVNRPVPATVPLENPTRVDTGGFHTCAVDAGAARCWGDNFDGQLGNGTLTSSSSPTTAIAQGITGISAGFAHSCAVADGAVYCWGSNSVGQLGDGTTNDSARPVRVIASGATSVSAGSAGTCAVVQGAAWCWGVYVDDSDFERSVPEEERRSLTPVRYLDAGVTQVSLGNQSSCAVVDSAVKCWGININGQLGNGTNQWSGTPVTTIESGATSVSVSSSGGCAVVQASVRCWGGGPLGDGRNEGSLTPVTVIASDVRGIFATGDSHSCASTVQNLRCWGIERSGELGDGGASYSTALSPVVVADF